jgi:hypothetical protein
MIFLDADITFANPEFAITAIPQALHLYKVVLPFESCNDLGQQNQTMQVHKSFGWSCWTLETKQMSCTFLSLDATSKGKHFHVFGNLWHPGFGLAFRR